MRIHKLACVVCCTRAAPSLVSSPDPTRAGGVWGRDYSEFSWNYEFHCKFFYRKLEWQARATAMELLAEASKLPEPQQRKVAAVLGALVADAAAQPIHWIYDDSVLTKVLAGASNPEFITPSANPYYRLPTGSQSPYGDQLLVMLESLVACKGFDAEDIARRIMAAFGPGSPYESPVTGLYQSVPKSAKDLSKCPIEGKWQTFCLNRFTKCHASGKTVADLEEEDTNVDPDNIPRMVPLVALYAGKPDMLQIAEDAALQLQVADTTLSITLATCRIMEKYILSVDGPVEKVVEDLKSPSRLHPQSLDRAVAGHLQTALESGGLSVVEATHKFGKA